MLIYLISRMLYTYNKILTYIKEYEKDNDFVLFETE